MKPTKDVRLAWVLGVLAVGLIFLFSFVLLPTIDPGRRVEGIAPDFSLPVIHGGEAGNRIRLSDYRGTVVVLDFWASWCGPCRKQMPILDRVSQKFDKKGVMVIGVNTDSDVAAARSFLAERPISYASVSDAAGKVSTKYHVTQLPTLVVIDGQGQITFSDARLLSERSLDEIVSSALKRTADNP